MREEFHGIKHEDATYTFKQLYGWGTMNVNVWLPSLSELVGTTGSEASNGCYQSAMQGLNTTTWYCVDTKGGAQWKLFEAYNASGGGEELWACGGSEQFLLRSVRWDNTVSCWMMLDTTYFHAPAATDSLAVHPAGKSIL